MAQRPETPSPPRSGISATPVPREQWASRTGFILAAVGSAVGLGNMWRFSYLTAENGGAAFLVLYFVMLLLVGLPIMLAEFVVGRGSKKSPILAFDQLGGRAWKPVGLLFVVCGFLVLSYYAVIAGWAVRFAGDALIGGFGADAGERFNDYAEGWDSLGFHLLFMAITIAIVSFGVRKGIERTAMILMPLLFVIVGGIAIYAAFQGGAGAGYAFYLQTDFSEIFSFQVLSQATGQAFFSLSLGMGVMITFASYLSRDDNLPRESVTIAGTDFMVAFVAGLMVFPLIFALGLSELVDESTVGALFISMPATFAEMGTAGSVVGFLFFAALMVGALTSALSLLEIVVASAMDQLAWTRRKATVIAGTAIAVAGIPSAFSLDVLDLVDHVSATLLVTLGGLIVAVFVGWRMKDPLAEASKGAGTVPWFPIWYGLLRYVIPPVLLVILYFGLVDLWGRLAGLMTGA